MKLYITLISFILICAYSLSAQASDEDQRVFIANSQVDCDNNRLGKDVGCELVLNYDHKNFDVYLIKLYKRDSGQTDINDMKRNPTAYKSNNLLIDYISKLDLKGREKVSTLSGSFIRDEKDKNKLKIKLRVGISKYRDVRPSDFDKKGAEESEEEALADDYEAPTEVVDSKRQKELVIPL